LQQHEQIEIPLAIRKSKRLLFHSPAIFNNNSHHLNLSNHMTKSQEIETLRECAEKLGPNSYCGDWLIDQLPFIESDMRSDFLPQMGWADTRKMEQNTLALAKEQAARILKDAEEQATRIKKDAQDRADLIRRTLRRELEKALDTL
jgi:hypothetical protein